MTFLSYGFNKYNSSKDILITKTNSHYFLNYRINDILYYQTDYSQHILCIKAKIKPKFVGIINLYLNYIHLNTQNSQFFRNNFRDETEQKRGLPRRG